MIATTMSFDHDRYTARRESVLPGVRTLQGITAIPPEATLPGAGLVTASLVLAPDTSAALASENPARPAVPAVAPVRIQTQANLRTRASSPITQTPLRQSDAPSRTPKFGTETMSRGTRSARLQFIPPTTATSEMTFGTGALSYVPDVEVGS